MLFAYLGKGAPPAFPDFDCFVAAEAYTFAFKGHAGVQLAAGAGSGHRPGACFLPAPLSEDEDPPAVYGKQFRGAPSDSDMPMAKMMRDIRRPEIEAEGAATACACSRCASINDARPIPV